MELCTTARNFFVRQTQFFAGILDVFQEKSGKEKEPLLGRFDIFQTSPKPKQPSEFWERLDTLYEVHNKPERLIVYCPEAAEECLRFERLVLLLQGVGLMWQLPT